MLKTLRMVFELPAFLDLRNGWNLKRFRVINRRKDFQVVELILTFSLAKRRN